MNSVLSHVCNTYVQIMVSGITTPYSVLGLAISFHKAGKENCPAS